MKVKILEINKEGQITQKTMAEQMSSLKCSLIEALYPGIQLAMVQVPLEPLDSFQQALVEQALGNLNVDGKPYRLVGASGSAKSGRFYAVPAMYEKKLGDRLQHWPEAAVSYFGILVSECRYGMIAEPNLAVLVVQDHQLGTNDCRGWIAQSLFSKWKDPAGKPLPARRFYQFRIAFDSFNAKGSFKVMGDEVAQLLKVDVVLPESCLKPSVKERNLLQKMLSPEGRRFHGSGVLGIREVSENLEYKSSYTLTVHAPEDSLQLE